MKLSLHDFSIVNATAPSTYAYVNFHHFCPNNFFLRLEQYFPHHTILNRKLCLQSCTHFFRLWVRNYVWYQIISTFFSQIHCTFLAFFKFTFSAAILSSYSAFPVVLSLSTYMQAILPCFIPCTFTQKKAFHLKQPLHSTLTLSMSLQKN